MNQEHIEALAKAAVRSYRAEADGGPIYSDGHFAVRADYPGNLHEQLLKMWAQCQALPGVRLTPGTLHIHGPHYYRKLMPGSVFINEAYWRAFYSEGCEVFGGDHKAPISIVRDGQLIAVIMPVKVSETPEMVKDDVPDAVVFAEFATERNGFYLQPTNAMIAKLREELGRAYRNLRNVQDKISDLEEEKEELQVEVFDIEAKMKVLQDEEVAV